MSVAAASGVLSGDLSGGGVESVLERLSRDAATGILTVQSDDDIITVSLEAGRIVGADALNESREDGLGRALMEARLLTREQFSRSVERIRGERGRLGEILLEETGLSRADYLGALRRYTVSLVETSCSWQRGEFRFFPGDEVSREDDFDPIELGPSGLAGPTQVIEPAHALERQPDEVAESPPLESAQVPEPSARQPAGRPSTPREASVPDDATFEIELSRRDVRERLLDLIDRAPDWIGWALPTFAVVLLATVVLWGPNLLVYPVFWLEPERLAFEQQRRASVYLKIDRAARTFFLLEGRFPDDLHTLVARGLLRSGDIVGAKGHLLRYAPGDRGYVIRSAVRDGTDAGVNEPEAIAGDFFLDPEYVVLAPQTDTPPLVLLD
jgi:hypothetical protein